MLSTLMIRVLNLTSFGPKSRGDTLGAIGKPTNAVRQRRRGIDKIEQNNNLELVVPVGSLEENTQVDNRVPMLTAEEEHALA